MCMCVGGCVEDVCVVSWCVKGGCIARVYVCVTEGV